MEMILPQLVEEAVRSSLLADSPDFSIEYPPCTFSSMSQTAPENAKQEGPSIRDLFPGLNDDHLREVEDTFHAYLEIAWRIYERIDRERPEFFDTLKDSS